MQKHIEIIGPCSKWIQDKGWTTLVPITLLEMQGFKKIQDDQIIISKTEYLQLKKGESYEKNNSR